MLRLVEEELGGERRVEASSDGEEEIWWDLHSRNHVLEDKSLVFKFLPL